MRSLVVLAVGVVLAVASGGSGEERAGTRANGGGQALLAPTTAPDEPVPGSKDQLVGNWVAVKADRGMTRLLVTRDAEKYRVEG